MNHAELFKHLNDIATTAAFLAVGENVMIYPCGFAWVNIYSKEKDEPFLNWLVSNGHARQEKKPGWKHPGKWQMWVSANFNQSVQHKEVYAEVMAKELEKIGYNASSGSRLD